MYIVGHSLSVVDSGACAPDELDGFGVVAAMLPDILDNHAWGYGTCFTWPADTDVTRFIRAHMIGDWFVHFGERNSADREGWAYRNMGHYAAQYEDFFRRAYQTGCVSQEAPSDSRRGFSHTMAEYSVDLWLSKCGRFDRYFDTARAALGTLGREEDDEPGSSHWLRRAMSEEKMPTEYRKASGQVESFRERAQMSREPGEFVIHSIMHKLGFAFTEQSRDFVRDCLDDGITTMGTAELDKHYRECCGFIADNLRAA